MILDISLDLGRAPSVLAALADQRLAQKCANAAAESYTEDVLDWIAEGKSFTPRHGGAGLEGSINWHNNGDGSATVFVNKEFESTVTDPETKKPYILRPYTYAAAVEFGTGPHIIRPKPDRKALKVPVGGGYILRRLVNHPGTKALPFMTADQEAREERMRDAARSVLAEALSRA